MATPAHSKIINQVAREILKPLGVQRKGQSRIWLDDNGWWVMVIEFQPSDWSKGTYLNVNVNWLWHPKEYYSFDLGTREAGYVEYQSDAQFEPKVREMAEIAKAKVLEMRSRLSDLKAAKKYIVKYYAAGAGTIWQHLHCGMICALAGDTAKAAKYFNKVAADPEDRDWIIELKQFTREASNCLTSSNDFASHVCNIIKESRRIKKLKEWECTFT